MQKQFCEISAAKHEFAKTVEHSAAEELKDFTVLLAADTKLLICSDIVAARPASSELSMSTQLLKCAQTTNGALLVEMDVPSQELKILFQTNFSAALRAIRLTNSTILSSVSNCSKQDSVIESVCSGATRKSTLPHQVFPHFFTPGQILFDSHLNMK